LSWNIVPLASGHDRRCFDCGEQELNDYIKRYAAQHAKKNVSRTYVAVADADPQRILGFFTLSSAQINFSELSSAMRKGLPSRYPIPAARIGRLAVDRRMQGQRIGEGLLLNALYRCAVISREMGIVGVIVDAKREQAQLFYRQYGFEPIPDDPLKLFAPIKDMAGLLPKR
jgi:GNAT superfamily N-acetyltransferase